MYNMGTVLNCPTVLTAVKKHRHNWGATIESWLLKVVIVGVVATGIQAQCLHNLATHPSKILKLLLTTTNLFSEKVN